MTTNHREAVIPLNLNAYMGYMLTHSPTIEYYNLSGTKHLIKTAPLHNIEGGARIIREFINTSTLNIFDIDPVCSSYVSTQLYTNASQYFQAMNIQAEYLYYQQVLTELQYNYVRGGARSAEYFYNLAHSTEIQISPKPEILFYIDVKPRGVCTYQGLISDEEYVHHVLNKTGDSKFHSKLLKFKNSKRSQV